MTKRKTRNTLVADFRRDIQESYVREAMPEVLDILLKDRTTGKNILWCTKDYESRGAGFGERDEIRAELISKPGDKVIVPRAWKSAEEQRRRVQEKDEVFTPAWICNAMNSQLNAA